MSLREAILARAAADDAVAAIAGNRIHWVERPQAEALPALVFQVIGGDRPEDLDGESEMRTTRVQATAFALEKAKGGGGLAQGIALIEAAISALLPDASAAGILFWRATAAEPRDTGTQTDTGFVFQADADLILRWIQE